jgi:hypothetical protein
VSTADRAAPEFADTEIDVTPLPLPDAPLAIVMKEALLVAVQLQLVPCWTTATLTDAVPHVAGIDTLAGETENVHADATTTMCVVPVAFW